jgi:hypothetical protein
MLSLNIVTKSLNIVTIWDKNCNNIGWKLLQSETDIVTIFESFYENLFLLFDTIK